MCPASWEKLGNIQNTQTIPRNGKKKNKTQQKPRRLNLRFNTFKNECITSSQSHHTIIISSTDGTTIICRDMKECLQIPETSDFKVGNLPELAGLLKIKTFSLDE